MYTLYYHVCPSDNGRPLMVCKNPERENCNMIVESVSMALLLTEIKEVLLDHPQDLEQRANYVIEGIDNIQFHEPNNAANGTSHDRGQRPSF